MLVLSVAQSPHGFCLYYTFLLILCLNGTKERWCRLNRICDVTALIYHQPLDWSWIIVQAKQRGCQRLIQIGLLLAHQLLAVPVTEPVLRWIRGDRTAQIIAQECQDSLFNALPIEPGEVERSLFHIRARERLSDQFKSFWGLMDHSGWFTPTQNDREVFPLPRYLSPLYFVIRPLRVIQKYFFSFSQAKQV